LKSSSIMSWTTFPSMGGRRRGNKRSIPPLAFSRTWTQVIQLPNNIRDKKKKRHSNKHLAFLNPKFQSRFAFFLTDVRV
jgi:hypothetical protein